MGMTDINNAAGAQNALTARMNAFLDSIDADIATRQAAYDALSSDLIGILPQQSLVTINYAPSEAENDLVAGGHFKDWNALKTFISSLPNGAGVRVILPRNSTLLVTGAFNSSAVFSVHLSFEADGSKTIAADSPVIMLEAYDGVTFSQYRSIDTGQNGSMQASGVVFAWQAPIDSGLPFSSNTFVFSYRSGGLVSLSDCKIVNDIGRPFSRTASGSIAKLSMNRVEIDGDGVMGIRRDSASSIAMVSVASVTLTNGALVHHSTFTRGGDLFTNYVQA